MAVSDVSAIIYNSYVKCSCFIWWFKCALQISWQSWATQLFKLLRKYVRISNLSLYFYLQFLTNATTFTLSYAYSCLALWWVQSLVGKLWFLKSCRQSSLWSPAIQNNEKEFFGPTNLFVITLGDPCHEEDWVREKKREFFFRWLDSNLLSRLTLFIGGYWWILPRKFVKNLSSHFQRVFSPQAWNLTRNCLSTYQCKMRNVQSMPCYFLFQHSNCYLQVLSNSCI